MAHVTCSPTVPSSQRTFAFHFSINQEDSYCVEGLSLQTYELLLNSDREARNFLYDLIGQGHIPLTTGSIDRMYMSSDGVHFKSIDQQSIPPSEENYENDPNNNYINFQIQDLEEVRSEQNIQQVNDLEGIISDQNIQQVDDLEEVEVDQNIQEADDSEKIGSERNVLQVDDLEEVEVDQNIPIDTLPSNKSKINRFKKLKNKKSNVWSYFIKTEQGGICKLCQSDVKSPGCTTNLARHLSRKHSTVNLDSSKSHILKNITHHKGNTQKSASSKSLNKNQRIDETIRNIASFKDGGSKCNVITNALLYMIVKDDLPFSATEKPGLRHLLHVVAPMYSIPGRNQITSRINSKYEAQTLIVKEKFKKIKWITLSADIWTKTMTSRSFFGCTAHFLNENKLSSIVLATSELTTNHTTANLSNEFISLLNYWEVPLEKIVAVVTDNGTNIVKAISDTFGDKKHLRCFAHSLNLVISSAIKETETLNNLLSKVKAIVKFFKSPVPSGILKSVQDESQPLRLIQDVPTRWNSTYDMLERFYEMIDCVSSALLQINKSPPMLTSEEVFIIRELISILRPAKIVTEELSGQNYSTSNKVITSVQYLRNAVSDVKTSSEIGMKVQENILSKLNSRFADIESNLLYSVATFLDPRYKCLYFTDILPKTAVMSYVNNCLRKESISSSRKQCEPKDYHENNDMKKYHNFLLNQNQFYYSAETNGVHIDLKQYLAKKNEPINCDPIQYWLSQKESTPELSDLALKHLSVISTSVPSERLFSQAGHVASETRNRISADNLFQLLFLKSLDIADWNL